MAKPQKKKPDLERLGANLRRERSAKGITQERLAELSGLNPRTIQKIEAGELNIVITTLMRLRRALRCPWQRLLD